MYEEVINYYNQCEIDYKWWWGLNRYQAIHYGFYDATHTTHGEAVINFNRVLASVAGIKNTDKILDAGCGIGGSSLWLAKHLGCDVTGISITPGQIETAKKMARDQNLSNRAHFYIQDYNRTSFADESFDVVWGLESICYARSKEKFLSEVNRLLKPGGRIVVADFFLQEKISKKSDQDKLKTWFEGWAMPNLPYEKEFRSYLESVGFQNIKFTNINKHIIPSSRRMYAMTLLFYPFAKAMQLMGLRTETQMKNMRAAFYQYVCLKKGLWSYGIFCAEKK